MDWVQVYDPLGSASLSTLIAAAPIVVLLGLLVAGMAAHRAAVLGLATALMVAIWAFGMPTSMAFASAGYGACFGLMPIGWIVFSAVLLYHLCVRSGQFEVVKRSVLAISPDRRMQALLIAFSFGAFLEGAAGFGTPVAISAALLIGIGFSPLYAAGLALIANTSPVAFGALGTPILALERSSGVPIMELGQMAGRQLTPFSLLIPFWMVFVMAGWRGVRTAWPAILVSGGVFAVVQFSVAEWAGPSLVGVAGGLASMVALALFLRVWHPPDCWRFPDEPPPSEQTLPHPTFRQGAYAWMPWLLLSAMVFVWGLSDVKAALRGICCPKVAVPALHNAVYRNQPVVRVAEGADRAEKPEEALYEASIIPATGTAIFLAAVVSAFWLRIRLRDFLWQIVETFWRVRLALLTIACMLAVAFTTKYCGSDGTLGLAFTHTGCLFPFFAPMLGWLGVALTGSDTSSNALFGSLQRITAEQLNLPPVLIVASNSTGGVMGKMIDAQSIVVAAVATGQAGHEGPILRFVFFHSLALACLIGLVTLAQAYWLTWTVPALP